VNNQKSRTLQEFRTTLAPDAVLLAARKFFSARNNVYTAYIERESANSIVMRGQGGEELVIAAQSDDGATRVTGSTYLFDQQVARFLSSLPPAWAAA
jgi:hypothetical protein